MPLGAIAARTILAIAPPVAIVLLSTHADAQRSTGSAGMEWTGTITVERRASGTLRSDDGKATIEFNGRQTVVYDVHGDGTASWHSQVTTHTGTNLYAVPVTGSGSGFGYAGVSFDGSEWYIHAAADEDVPVRIDYTQQDKAWENYSIITLLKEIARASGQPAPSAGPRIERGTFGVPGASVPARGASNVTTLSGSASETVPGGADAMGGPGTIPLEATVTWNLRKGPARSHVRVYGSDCGCIDPGETQTSMRFIAGASPAGGEFSEFIVTASGQQPEILSNAGGEQPSLEIAGTRETGTVTLKIRYRRNGIVAESEPFTVEFCDIEDIELADGDEHDLAFDLDGRLDVEAKAKAWRGGRDVTGGLEWDLEEMGAPTSLAAEPSEQKGERIRFTYTGLPRRNSDFGPKRLTATIGGTCDCEREEIVRTFYPDVADDHPDDGTPNWFYYWKQTSAVPDEVKPILHYLPSISDPNMPGRPIARYDHASQRILISSDVFGRGACRGQVDATGAPAGRTAEGIDCFGETVRHELQHRADAIAWWGSPAGPYQVNLLEWFLKDWDHDQVPNTVEERLAGCRPGEWVNAPLDLARLLTMQHDLIERGKRTWFTCQKRPFSDVTDAEINAYEQGWTWPIGSADREDWSCGELSKQWNGKKCGP
jgi:hypothetical protein